MHPSGHFRLFPAPLLTIASQPQCELQSRLSLNLAIRQRAAVLHLDARENEALQSGHNSLDVADELLDVLDQVPRIDIKSDRLARQRLDLRSAGRQRQADTARKRECAARRSSGETHALFDQLQVSTHKYLH